MRTRPPRLLCQPPSASDSEMFYRHVLDALNAHGVPYLVGGGYAINHYTGLNRSTKDMDLFIRRTDYGRVKDAFPEGEYEMHLTYPHWLGKLLFNAAYIDFIFSSGNGIATVDEIWFQHAEHATILGVSTRLCPVEEMIWSKAFVMERERYDGADVAHLLQARGRSLRWAHLLERFDAHWRVLLSHLMLFGYVYPDQTDVIPADVMDALQKRLRQEAMAPVRTPSVCRGTLLSREQYLHDIQQWGMQDGRIIPFGNLTASETEMWTLGIPKEKPCGDTHNVHGAKFADD